MTLGTLRYTWAAARGLDDVVQLLVDKGAQINAKNKKAQTPLTMTESGRTAPRASTAALLRKLGATE